MASHHERAVGRSQSLRACRAYGGASSHLYLTKITRRVLKVESILPHQLSADHLKRKFLTLVLPLGNINHRALREPPAERQKEFCAVDHYLMHPIDSEKRCAGNIISSWRKSIHWRELVVPKPLPKMHSTRSRFARVG